MVYKLHQTYILQLFYTWKQSRKTTYLCTYTLCASCMRKMTCNGLKLKVSRRSGLFIRNPADSLYPCELFWNFQISPLQSFPSPLTTRSPKNPWFDTLSPPPLWGYLRTPTRSVIWLLLKGNTRSKESPQNLWIEMEGGGERRTLSQQFFSRFMLWCV